MALIGGARDAGLAARPDRLIAGRVVTGGRQYDVVPEPLAGADPMLGQLCLAPPLPCDGAGLLRPGVVVVVCGVVALLVLPVVVVDVAAFAIAAPPPAIAAVAASVTISGLILRICSPPFIDHPRRCSWPVGRG
jgi:hypothetical protein